MAYKRYIKRGGKVYGPYIYHSKKVKGKVISEYRGVDEDRGGERKQLFLLAVFSLFVILSFSTFSQVVDFSGTVTNQPLKNFAPDYVLILDGLVKKELGEILRIIPSFAEQITSITGMVPGIIPGTFNDSEGFTVTTVQYDAFLNRPVKWKKTIKPERNGTIRAILPKGATKIKVYNIVYDDSGKVPEAEENITEEPPPENITVDIIPEENITAEENVTTEEEEPHLNETEEPPAEPGLGEAPPPVEEQKPENKTVSDEPFIEGAPITGLITEGVPEGSGTVIEEPAEETPTPEPSPEPLDETQP
ncbi:MAG: hypothetical protein JSV92_04090, partial [archaeon]